MPRRICLSLVVAIFAAPAFAQSERDVINAYDRGNQLKAAYKYDEADQEYKRGLNLALRIYGETHKNTVMLFREMGNLYVRQGKWAEAEKYYARSLRARETLNGAEHLDNATDLSALASLAMERQKPEEAEKQLKRALAIREKHKGEDSVEVADTLNDLAIVAGKRGNPAEAEKLYRRSLIIREKTDGPNSLIVAQSLSNLGLALHDLEQYKDAEDAHRRALAIREKAKGKNDPVAAESLNNLAILLRDLGRYQEAEDLHRRALKIRETALGPDNIKTASTVNNLAILCMDQGRYVEASGLLRRALSIYVRSYGPDHATVADTVSNIAQMERNRGRYADAERIHRQALAVVEKVFGANHEAVAGKLNNLAALLAEEGRYADADTLYRQALKIRESVFGPNHNLVADSLNNLGNLCVDRGQAKEARSLLEQAYKIRESAYGLEHPMVAQAANNVAIALGKIGDRKSAEAILKNNLANVEKVFGKEHPAYADALFNLAGCHYDAGRYAEAEAAYREVRPLFEKMLGNRHPQVADTLTQLGNCLRAEGKLDAARECHQQAREIMQKAFGQDHPAVFASTQNLAMDAWLDGNAKVALGLFDEQRKSARRYMLRELPFAPLADQRDFLGTSDVDQLARALSIVSAKPKDRDAVIKAGNWQIDKIDQEVARKSAEWLANGKGMSIEARTVRARLDRDITEPEARQALAEIIDLRNREMALGLQENGAAAANVKKLRTETWVRRRLVEQTLASSKGAGTVHPWVDLDSIRQAIPKDGLLIDIARFRPVRLANRADEAGWDDARYIAWVIPPTGDIAIVDLGEAAKLDDAVHAAMRIIPTSADRSREIGERRSEQMAHEAMQRISDMILKPITSHLKDVNHLIISPDGDLWLLPWAALAYNGEQYLVETFTPRLVISSRDLVRPAEAPKLETTPAFIVADPNLEAIPTPTKPILAGAEATGKLADFEATFVFGEAGKLAVRVPEGEIIGQGRWKQEGDAVQMETERSVYEGKINGRFLQGQRRIKDMQNAPPDPFTIELPDRLATRGFANGAPRARAIPLTRLEGETAFVKLKAIFGSEPRLLTDVKATEAAVKSVVRPKALVFATPGLFPPPAKDEKLSDPLSRCGLVVAGYNKRATAGPADEDGVLTGQEIVGLDLRGTKFVVLSSCDTALGETAGDSIAALRQAFQMAGAADVISTLWPVPDTETGRLIGRFYDRLASGANQADVLAAAQREAINDRRKKNGTAHPYYWGALTITGRD
jgi:tetratricopeptide (TPR) repeat protein/CHAT domain-containing protein